MLDEGEATLFLTDKKARLIIDELNARRIADAENREYAGLLGLICHNELNLRHRFVIHKGGEMVFSG